jgi:hypothetical protein
MKSGESDLNLLSDLNSVSLRSSELLRVIEATAKIRKGSRRGHIMGTIATIKNRSYSNKATAIILRLQALAKLAEKNELRHWILAEETDFSPTMAHRALISAAAKHPLSLINGDFVFERDSFLRRVLELAQPEGSLQ